MLSLFPSLLTLSFFAPLILRITLGLVFLYWAYRGYKSKKPIVLYSLDGIVGILLIIGLCTQLATLTASLILILGLMKKIRTKAFFTDGVNYYFILLVIAISLLLTGPGVFAFDLPL